MRAGAALIPLLTNARVTPSLTDGLLILFPGGGDYLEREALAAAEDFDFVLPARLHLGERLRVVVYVLHVAAREFDYHVPSHEPRGLRGRALAYAVELEA